MQNVVVAQPPQAPQVFRQFAQPADPEPKIAGVPFWLASLGSFLVVTALALLVAVRKVAAPGRGRAA